MRPAGLDAGYGFEVELDAVLAPSHERRHTHPGRPTDEPDDDHLLGRPATMPVTVLAEELWLWDRVVVAEHHEWCAGGSPSGVAVRRRARERAAPPDGDRQPQGPDGLSTRSKPDENVR